MKTVLIAGLLAGLAGSPALAELEAGVAVTSDYRFRGVSLSDEDPALQANIDWSGPGGFYVGAWGSTIAPLGDADVEVDLYAGFLRPLGEAELDVGVLIYTYPGQADTAYAEIYAGLTFPTGPVTSSLGAAWAPEQDNLGGQDDLYLSYAAEAPLGDTGLTAFAGVGYETGAFGDPDGDGDDKIDWTLGFGGAVAGIDWTLAYVDTSEDGPLSDATVVLSIGKAF
ncbi:MAG: TorF family putative porin [Alphaproteobacteria bacterium]|nr:TorF family putative porin [Alphaproteobacteria bacterium]